MFIAGAGGCRTVRISSGLLHPQATAVPVATAKAEALW